MLECLLAGKLVGAPEQRTSKGGKTYVTARMRVPAGAEETHFARLTAFSDSACAALLALGDGDGLAVAGTLKIGVWAPQGGEPRPNLDLVASQVLTLYHLERRRKAVQSGDDAPDPSTPRPARRQAPAQRSLDHDDDFGGGAEGDAWLRGAP